MTDASGDAPTVEELIDVLRERVAKRRAQGDYPENLEDDLDSHFRRIALRPPDESYDFQGLRSRLHAATPSFSFSERRIDLGSRAPGGSQLHQSIAKVVGRQTQGVLAQMQVFADAVRELLFEFVDAIEAPQSHQHTDLMGRLDAVFERLASYERTPSDPVLAQADIRKRLDALEAAEERRAFRPWYSSDRFEEEFRGERDELLQRYETLAARFDGCEPVVDLGCGRGEFLDLLSAAGVPARGVDIDPELVQKGRKRGVAMEQGDAVAWLRAAPERSLGGIAMIQVIEHLSPQDVVDVIALSAKRLKAGGRLIVETVNPQSLYVFAHAFYLDPTHHAPVHPSYLLFLCREAGFTHVEIEWRSPPPADDVLESPGSVEGDANVARLNQLLFAPQDYAIIATA